VSYVIPVVSGTFADRFGFKKVLIVSYLAYLPSILGGTDAALKPPQRKRDSSAYTTEGINFNLAMFLNCVIITKKCPELAISD
jgi:hypothetical protein